MSESFASMHWSALKKLVEEKGGKYEGKEQAIAFLTGSEPAPDAQPVAAPAVAKNSAVFFDKSKPYGDVSGEIEGMPSARYFQGGHYFNPQGEKVG